VSEEYDGEAIRAFLGLLRGIQQDRAIARAELALMDTPELTPFPMPNTAHHSISGAADFVRAWRQDAPIRIPLYRDAFASGSETTGPPSPTNTSITLIARKVWAPAPFVARFVGDEAAYTWRAWGDGSSRYITTDAELVWR
jgi:hypothetical protein